jgi:hypothetical protein
MIRVALRVVVVAIAIAAAIDPGVSIVAATRPRIAIVVQHPQAAEAERVRAALTRNLAAGYDVVPHIVSDASAAIVIGDRYPDEPLPDALPASTVTIAGPIDTVRLLRVAAPREVPPATAIRVDVDLVNHAATGRMTELRARVGPLQSGFAAHEWTRDGEQWHASLDLVPIGESPFVVRLEAVTPGTAAGGAETANADLVVRRRDAPLAVEFFDARPSWTSTFVRRALESDPRFHVESLSRSARSLSTRTAGAVSPGDRRLDAFAAVVVGGLERLSATDVAALEAYMRVRGGTVVLLPDQRIDAGAVRAMVPDLAERLLERPAALISPAGAPSLLASELLVASTLPPGSDVLARAAGTDRAPVVITVPRGDGRLLVSGAMDAWRNRAASDAAFDRFWQSMIAGLALATPAALDVDVMPPLLRPREAAEILVRVRGGEPASVSASAGGQPVRLAPAAERGVYRGRFTAPAAGARMSIDVNAVDAAGRVESSAVTIPMRSDAQLAPRLTPPLSLLAASHYGVDVTPDRVMEVERFVRETVAVQRAAAIRHPMRSPWWLVPFVGCLSIEWWLRRRRGLR